MSMVDYQPGSSTFHLPQRRPFPLTTVPDPRLQSLTQAQYNLQQRSTSLTNGHPKPSSYALPSSTMTSASPLYTQHTPHNTNPISYQAHMNTYDSTARRTLSNATTSTASTRDGVPVRKNSASTSTLERTVSSRSGSSPISYVALMRKQKATVWSDRAQLEDPRRLAALRAAKQRAIQEVSSSHPHLSSTTLTSASAGYSITNGVRSKIRHHGAPKAQQYAPAAQRGFGVPIRLSANEVDEDDDDGDGHSHGARNEMNRRSDSGRSSLGSAGKLFGGEAVSPGGAGAGAVHRKTDSQSTAVELPAPPPSRNAEYVALSGSMGGGKAVRSSADSNTSGSERENSFGGVGRLPVRRHDDRQEEEGGMGAEDLRRRGSVDERSMTMNGYARLFVANPDVE